MQRKMGRLMGSGRAPDGIHIFFLFLHKNICCGYSLEVPHRSASNEYPQHMFLCKNKKNICIFWMKKAPYLELCSRYVVGTIKDL